MDHLKLIDEKIAHYEAELGKLRNAREVLVGLSEDRQAAEKSKARTTPKKRSKPKANGTSKPAENGAPVRQRLTEVLQAADDPMTSADLIVALGMTEKKQPVYTALSSMAAAGEVLKDEQRRYRIPVHA